MSADDADKAVGLIDAALAADGPLTRAQLGDVIAAPESGPRARRSCTCWPGRRSAGLIIRGPDDRASARVRPGRRLARRAARPVRPGQVRPDVALAELAQAVLAGHAPASERDLAKWAGLPVRDARRGLSAIAASCASARTGSPNWHQRGRRSRTEPAPGLPPPRLLGSFDPLLHGWVDQGAGARHGDRAS